jgi:hypothetical protein
LEGLGIVKVGIFYGRLEYITAILRAFGNLAAIWYIFSRFGILCHEKSGSLECGVLIIYEKKNTIVQR